MAVDPVRIRHMSTRRAATESLSGSDPFGAEETRLTRSSSRCGVADR